VEKSIGLFLCRDALKNRFHCQSPELNNVRTAGRKGFNTHTPTALLLTKPAFVDLAIFANSPSELKYHYEGQGSFDCSGMRKKNASN